MIVAGRSAASDTPSERNLSGQNLDDALCRGFDKVNVCAEILEIGAGVDILRRALTAGFLLPAQAEGMGLRKARSRRVFGKEIASRPVFGSADQGVVREQDGVDTAFQNSNGTLPVGLEYAVVRSAASGGDFLFVDLDQIIGESKVLRLRTLNSHVDEYSRRQRSDMIDSYIF